MYDYWVVSGIFMIRRSWNSAYMHLANNLLLDFLDEARFSNARLAAEHNDLALSSFGPLPASAEKCHLFLRSTRGIKPALVTTSKRLRAPLTEHAIHFDRLGDPFSI